MNNHKYIVEWLDAITGNYKLVGSTNDIDMARCLMWAVNEYNRSHVEICEINDFGCYEMIENTGMENGKAA